MSMLPRLILACLAYRHPPFPTHTRRPSPPTHTTPPWSVIDRRVLVHADGSTASGSFPDGTQFQTSAGTSRISITFASASGNCTGSYIIAGTGARGVMGPVCSRRAPQRQTVLHAREAHLFTRTALAGPTNKLQVTACLASAPKPELRLHFCEKECAIGPFRPPVAAYYSSDGTGSSAGHTWQPLWNVLFVACKTIL